MDDNTKPGVNPEYTIEKFDDEILLYTATGTQAIYLNDTAHVVLLLCKEGLTIGQIVGYLEEQYSEQNTQIKDDVYSALNTLESHSIIELSDD